MPKPKKTFEQWFKEVDAEINRRVYLGADDLPDCPYRDWFEAGVTVKGAASRAVKRASE